MHSQDNQHVVLTLIDFVWSRRGKLKLSNWSLLTCFLLVAIGLPGCFRSESKTVTVFVASSVVQTMQEIKASFEHTYPGIHIEVVSAGSQVLAMQIIEGAPADIFISADIRQMKRVQGFAEPLVLVENNLIAIAGFNSVSSTVDEAIAQASRIVIAQDAVPAGQYTYQALNAMGLWEDMESKVVSYEHSVNGVLTKVVMGQADLGFVYKTDALSEMDTVRIVKFPESIPVATQTWIAQKAGTSGAASPVSSVYQYIKASPDSNRIFSRHGFQLVGTSP